MKHQKIHIYISRLLDQNLIRHRAMRDTESRVLFETQDYIGNTHFMAHGEYEQKAGVLFNCRYRITESL